MPRGKQSGIRYGQKKQQGQSDTEQLIEIRSHIRKKYKIKKGNLFREPYLLFDSVTEKLLPGIFDTLKKEQLEGTIQKNPDILWIDKYGMWVLEVDGAVHDRKVEKTRKRNELFISNHIKLIVVNLADIKELGLNIYDYIDDQILERIKNG